MKRPLLGLAFLFTGCPQTDVQSQVLTIERYVNIDSGAGGAEVVLKTHDGKVLTYRTDNATGINNSKLAPGDRIWVDLIDNRVTSLGERSTGLEGAETPH